ncbi:IGR protein motif-domain-containing protein [Aspergillus ambiguus]|uniref:mitochondrial 37S ribosomal protein mS41 n=1 Tax=Aspergillus ambiguus TaxID=176160 RepID=UPI003CCD9185
MPVSMAMRSSTLLSSRFLRPFTIGKTCVRCFHKNTTPRTAPSPTPFVPDVETFLTLIGRGMSKHASKLPSWEKLFTLSSTELRDLGIEPARQRRYLLRKREKFRQGAYGPGGDLEHVVDGAAQLRVVEVPLDGETSSASATLSPGMRKAVVNLPPDATSYTHDTSKPLKKFAHMKVHNGSMIRGPFLQPLKGTNGSAALIKVQEGMWEDKLGHKVDGGERRRAEVRAKKRSEERRKGTA